MAKRYYPKDPTTLICKGFFGDKDENGVVQYIQYGEIDIVKIYTDPNFDYIIFEDEQHIQQDMWEYRFNPRNKKYILSVCNTNLKELELLEEEIKLKLNSSNKFERKKGKFMNREKQQLTYTYYHTIVKTVINEWTHWIQAEFNDNRSPIFFKINEYKK